MRFAAGPTTPTTPTKPAEPAEPATADVDAPVEVGVAAPGAPPCCQICPARFISDLQLLQLSASATRAAAGSFAAWHAARTGAAPREASRAARAIARAVLSRGDDAATALLEVHASLGTTAQARTATTTAKVGEDLLAPGQRCCPMCPLDFVPEEAGYSLIETDAALGGAAGRAAGSLSAALQCARRRARRSASARPAPAAPTEEDRCVPAEAPGWVSPSVGTVLGRDGSMAPSGDAALLEVGATGRLGYASEKDAKGGARLNPATSPWGPHAICCNICPAAYHTPGDVPLGPTVGAAFLEVAARSAKAGLEVAGGLVGVNGYRGCCTLCGAKLMGAGEWGATPFSEPGSRLQHEGGATVELARENMGKGPPKTKR